jgi:polysaccharide chain length determinant protein (PEP-CTERM system associated)
MQDLFERLLGELRNAWRFRWQALAAVWGVALAGWLVVYALPNQYQASARVHVDTASFLGPLLRGLAVQPNLNQEVQLLTKTLLSTPNLEEIARKSNLDLGGLTPDEKASLLNGLRNSIEIKNAGTDLYVISYVNPKPVMAKEVVQQVLNVMMTNALGSSQQSSVAAQSFLKKQVEDYAKQLNEAEQALARFKRENVGLMPSSGGGDYFTQLQKVQSGRESLQNQLAIASAQQQTLSRQIHAMKTGKTPVRPESDPQVQALNTQIQSDQQQLNSLLTQYTDAYPGVVDLKDRIRLEKKQRDELIAKLRNKKTDTFNPADPVYQDLSMQLNKTSVQIQTLKTQIAQADAQIAKLKSTAGQMADIQAQFESLTRNYQVTKKQYDSLLSRLYSAQLSQSAQTSGNPLKFQVVDPPVTPLTPAAPKRHLMAFMVLIVALGAGGALAYLLSQIRPVFMTRSELIEMFALPVIGAVSFAGAPSFRRMQRSKLTLFWAGCGVFLLAGIIAILFANQGAHLVQTRLLGGQL